MNPGNGVVIRSTIGFLLSSHDLETSSLPAEPCSTAVEETNVGVTEAKCFNHSSSTGDRVYFDVHSDKVAETICKFLRVFFRVLVFFFCFKGNCEAVVFIFTLWKTDGV